MQWVLLAQFSSFFRMGVLMDYVLCFLSGIAFSALFLFAQSLYHTISSSDGQTYEALVAELKREWEKATRGPYRG